MSDSFWMVFGIVGVAVAFLLTYFLGTYFYTSLIHTASYKKLKASAQALKGQSTHNEAFVGISYAKSSKTRSFLFNPYVVSRLLIKDEGLLFKPILAKSFGLQFGNITFINIEINDKLFTYPYIITINSIGNVTDRITFRINKDVFFLEELSRCYKGEIIGYEVIQ